MAIAITQSGRDAVISVQGVFDDAAAARLLLVLPPSKLGPANVVIDFSKAREITPTGLAALLPAARGDALDLRFRGLCERHHRILKLLSKAANDHATS
ncbi:MAG TPA: hypothetical protein VFK85_00225 [Anaeromyxobacteraceae bacterium]|nr:hypothetical protein [Anaeromyxobacteraceae bacterium]